MNHLKAYREMAAGGKQFRGLSIISNAKEIGEFLRTVGAKDVLDFGSGAGDAYRSPHKIHHTYFGLKRSDVTLYDPSFKGIDVLPKRTFEAVVCSDVLEHIPEVDVPEFIATLFEHARLGVWASVCCRGAKKTFPGTKVNLHATVKPLEWWQEKFANSCNPYIRWQLTETK